MAELTDFQRQLAALCPQTYMRYVEPLTRHTSIRIGWEEAVMAFPKTVEELAQLLKASSLLDAEPAILGAGTNVLAPDAGMPGLVICLKGGLVGMERLPGSRIRLMAGVTLRRGAVFAAEQGLSGLEFAHGIPGSVGGGVYMNAGAYGGEMRQVVESARILERGGTVRSLSRQELDFSYRHSALEGSGAILLSADFQLMEAPQEQIREKMADLAARRLASQPLDLPSAGSAFKRPAGGYAAALIEQAGLKGLRIGGAAVSEKHAGFVVNLGGATAADVQALLRCVSDRVFQNTGIRLEPEIRIW